MTLFRSTPMGRLLRFLTNNRILQYPEEKPGFEIPAQYLSSRLDSELPSDLEKEKPRRPSDADAGVLGDGTIDVEFARDAIVDDSASDKTRVPSTTVAWYSDNDPENPHNWTPRRKGFIAAVLFTYTFAAYIGSSLYTAAVPAIRERYGASETVANLGLSLYVWGYGIGPLLFSPLSEIPQIGRNPPYAVTFLLFTVLTVPMALVDNMAGILVLRFLLGVFCSPSLATVGASYGDFMSPNMMEYVIALWGGGASLAPALGPVVAGYAVQAKGWRWSTWELLWLAGPILILLLFTLPETSADAILLQRAQRLRAITGRSDLLAESEIRQRHMSSRTIAFDALIKPWEINALDPAVLFTTVYMALVYGTYYSFFESFPLVFVDVYHFSAGSLGLSFLSILAGVAVAMVGMVIYISVIAPRRYAKMEVITPEARLWPGLIASFFVPAGLFIFAWTARASIHWIVCMIGVALSLWGIFVVTQAILVYIPSSYQKYAGSLFAANGLVRALFAGSAVLFSPVMFRTLKVSGGVSLLAGLSVVCIFGMYGIFFFGASLRRRRSDED
ncbi:hypothetical protein G7046_g1480 [Stylonectria norvegica]|nr:hypothetical protein G7046_g1480 [Stylonectria norvegica]